MWEKGRIEREQDPRSKTHAFAYGTDGSLDQLVLALGKRLDKLEEELMDFKR